MELIRTRGQNILHGLFPLPTDSSPHLLLHLIDSLSLIGFQEGRGLPMPGADLALVTYHMGEKLESCGLQAREHTPGSVSLQGAFPQKGSTR